jgi:outer membrane receptor protein involved in Fe transport
VVRRHDLPSPAELNGTQRYFDRQRKDDSMKTRNVCLVVAILLLLPGTALGQKIPAGILTGHVTDGKLPLPGVTVTVTSPNLQGTRTAYSTVNGDYILDLLPPGLYTVKFEIAGFETVQTTVKLSGDLTSTVDAVMLQAVKLAEQVTVTGSLIPRPTLEAMAPVTTVDPEQLTYRGLTRLEDLLQTLPQVFAGQNSTVSNGASGTATVDLRNLLSVRTLVLIDGKRQVPGDTHEIAPDLNFIPQFLIKRVDILTGGASSVYGADAVAGVVNIVLNRDFNGLIGGITFGGFEHNNNSSIAAEINTNKGFTYPTGQAWDGGALDVNIGLGGSFAEGKGHAAGYAEYRTTSALKKDRRDYTNCSVSALGTTGPACGGALAIPNGWFLAFNSNYSALMGSYTLDTSGPGNTLRRRLSTDLWNYAPYNYMQRPDQKWLGGSFVDYEWNRHFHAYLDVMLMDDTTDAQIAPSGDFGTTTQLNCDNPMLSEQERTLLCTNSGYGPHDMANVVVVKRNIEGGARYDHLSHTAYRAVGGLKGDISNAWSYDVWGLQAATRIPEQYVNDLNTRSMQDALIVDGDPNNPASWHCRSGNAGCVPWDVFKIGGVTQAAINYISLPLLSISATRTQMVNAELHGDLKDAGIRLPSASDGVQVALGVDYRKEYLSYQPDAAYQAGIGSGQGAAAVPVSGHYSVKELYLEGLFPLVQGAKGARNLSLDLAYRWSDYNVNGQQPSYKAEALWAPSADFMLRGGYARASRAPNVVELYTPPGGGSGGGPDPCEGDTPLYTQAQCANTGMTAAQYGHVLANPAGGTNSIGGGNPKLNPETADTVTYGVVVTPAGSRFTAALDYFDIKIKNTIGSLGGGDILTYCATTGNPELCRLIHRDQAGTLWLSPSGYIDTTNQNIGTLRSEGVDVNLGYGVVAGNAFFNFKLIGTYLLNESINTGIFAYDCVRFYGEQCGLPKPVWRHLFTASWEKGPVVLSAGWRMVGGVWNDDVSSNPAIGDPANIGTLKLNDAYYIPVQNYYDLAFAYKLKAGVTFMLGINNVLDTAPPLGSGSSLNDYGAGFRGTYDSYGRYLFSTVHFTF